METDLTAELRPDPADTAAHRITVTRVLLERAADQLDRLGVLLVAEELDRRALRTEHNEAFRLVLLAADEVRALER